MLSRFRPRLTYANVMATLGVFLGLGGGAYAVSTTLPKNSVGTNQIKDAAVTRPKLHADAVTGRKVKNKSLTGADVAASTLGKVPAATSSDQLGGAPASAFQRQVTTVCPDAAISKISQDGLAQCSRRIPITAVITMAPSAPGADGRVVGNDVEVDVLCHYPGGGGGTKVRIDNEGTDAATINWLYSNGTSVSASGNSIGGGGAGQSFDFSGKRLEGQFILARGTAVSTINLHAFDGGTFCEVTGTAQGAPASP